MADDSRPNPLGDAAKKAGTIWAAVSAVVGALVSFGVLNVAQADALNAAGAQLPASILALGAVVGGVVPLATAVVSAFHTAASAKPNVTPSEDPRDDHGTPLAPAGISGLEA